MASTLFINVADAPASHRYWDVFFCFVPTVFFFVWVLEAFFAGGLEAIAELFTSAPVFVPVFARVLAPAWDLLART